MTDEQQKDPQWKAMDLATLVPVQITLESATPVASGESKYGTWNLWAISVENATVHDRENKKLIPGYTGKAVCFPSELLHKGFLEHTNGTQEKVLVEVTKVEKENSKGKYTTFQTKKLEEGSTPSSNLLGMQNELIKNFKQFMENKIIRGTEEDFINMGKTDSYKFSDETIAKLWAVYNEQ